MTKKIAVLSGAFENGGDFFITLRGKELLEKKLGKDFQLEIVLRNKKFDTSKYDGLVITGGPIVTAKLHKQAKAIYESIKNTNIPVFTLGVGIGGKKDISKFKFDEDSKNFWEKIYKLNKQPLSVRDEFTKRIFSKIKIKAEITGCPTLHTYEKKTTKKDYKSIVINTPNLKNIFPYRTKHFIDTIYMLNKVKSISKKYDLKVGVIFPHGVKYTPDKILAKICKKNNYEILNYENKSFDEGNAIDYEINIGPRLHTHIYYLTKNKPSYLLNIDLRTYGFSNTIKSFPREIFNQSGIKKLISKIDSDLKNDKIIESFKNLDIERKKLEKNMLKYIKSIKDFYSKSSN